VRRGETSCDKHQQINSFTNFHSSLCLPSHSFTIHRHTSHATFTSFPSFSLDSTRAPAYRLISPAQHFSRCRLLLLLHSHSDNPLCASVMAPSATSIHEVEHINHLVLTEKDINIEHNIDDHVAFGTIKVLRPFQKPSSPSRLY
jgi:hypothetical protein